MVHLSHSLQRAAATMKAFSLVIVALMVVSCAHGQDEIDPDPPGPGGEIPGLPDPLPKLTLSPHKSYLKLGESQTLTATLLSSSGTPIANWTVEFAVAGDCKVLTSVLNATTDANGQATLTVESPDTPGGVVVVAIAFDEFGAKVGCSPAKIFWYVHDRHMAYEHEKSWGKHKHGKHHSEADMYYEAAMMKLGAGEAPVTSAMGTPAKPQGKKDL